MIFSKSFGYAVRGILYVAMMQDTKQFVQTEEIATTLAIPRHFMGKVLKKLAKEDVLSSAKGPSGGFTINENTLALPLIRIVDITNGLSSLKSCVLRMKECNAANPCPLHYSMEAIKKEMRSILSETTIADLLNGNKNEFIRSIASM